MPSEGQDIVPMGIGMQQSAELRRIAGREGGLGGGKPLGGRAPGLRRRVKLQQGLILIRHLRLALPWRC